MTNIPALITKYGALWEKTEITPNRLAEVNVVARRLVAPKAKARYQVISATTGVPWWVIAIIHERESGQDFGTQLGQGDPLGKISRHVPRGRGPFFNHADDPPGQDAFYRAAVDALQNCPPYTARWKDWSPGGTLVAFMLYNGSGYEDFHHEVSPYDFGATNQEQRGKYTGDGVYSATAWDTQVGCAAMLKAMMTMDPEIVFPQRSA